MLKGKVVGNVVSTRKQQALVGYKFLEVNLIENGKATDEFLIAVDTVGAGIGEVVLVTTGSGSRVATREDVPVDAAIVGIVDY